MKGIFSPFINLQSRYREGDIVSALRNAISMKRYVETYVRNSPSVRTPSSDTIFRRIKDVESRDVKQVDVNLHYSYRQYYSNTGSRILSDLIDYTLNTAISLGYFHESANVGIDEHDTPYHGMDNADLINAPFHTYRGTDMAYTFATLESLQNGSRLTLSAIRKTTLDGIDNTSETRMLLKRAMDLGISIRFVLIDRGILDADVMKAVDSMNLKYIVPAKDNKKSRGSRTSRCIIPTASWQDT